MAARAGRQVTFFFGGNSPGDQILGVREKGLECNGDPINITSDEDSGVRTLLENLSAEDTVNLSISGVTKDTRLKEAWFDGERTQAITLNYPDGSSLTGTFYLVSYAETDPYNEATTFQASLQSSGTVTFTPA
jgi:predicted secreted protein